MMLQDPPEKQFTVSGGRRGSQRVRSNKQRYGGQVARFSRDKMSTVHHKCNQISLYQSQAMIRSIYHICTVTCHKYFDFAHVVHMHTYAVSSRSHANGPHSMHALNDRATNTPK